MLGGLLGVCELGACFLPGLALIAAAGASEARSRQVGRAGEARVRHAIESASLAALHDILLPHPTRPGETTQIDHVLRLKEGILVIETKTYGGDIAYAFPDAAEWTHLHRGGDEAVPNPLLQNALHRQAVKKATGLEPVGLVVFAGFAEFVGGRPAGVVSLDEFDAGVKAAAADLFFVDPSAPERLDAAWQALAAAAAASTPKAKAGHRRRLAAAFGETFGFEDRRRLAGLVAGLAWLAAGAFLAF